ncbi:hypothetical protein E2C01_053522 [Portunus trituberculatus]|uniref:Uncharacterized protein n=1 Tax=Portunus trituberculatus TaxID=210409 RepID=A0A5B7GKJ7_PORTR|nr:hypothetical protein [Portunus trituberculatus]
MRGSHVLSFRELTGRGRQGGTSSQFQPTIPTTSIVFSSPQPFLFPFLPCPPSPSLRLPDCSLPSLWRGARLSGPVMVSGFTAIHWLLNCPDRTNLVAVAVFCYSEAAGHVVSHQRLNILLLSALHATLGAVHGNLILSQPESCHFSNSAAPWQRAGSGTAP